MTSRHCFFPTVSERTAWERLITLPKVLWGDSGQGQTGSWGQDLSPTTIATRHHPGSAETPLSSRRPAPRSLPSTPFPVPGFCKRPPAKGYMQISAQSNPPSQGTALGAVVIHHPPPPGKGEARLWGRGRRSCQPAKPSANTTPGSREDKAGESPPPHLRLEKLRCESCCLFWILPSAFPDQKEGSVLKSSCR